MSFSDKVVNLLKDKIKVISTENSTIYLVGPINLPVQLDGETKMFKWYCWLPCKEIASDDAECDSISRDTESLIAKLSSADLAEMQQSSVLVHGDFEQADQALIRMHSICHTGDIFGSRRCDCGFQLKQSMKMIQSADAGALFYLANHEGRGIGLFSKALAYVLQEQGYDTVEANLNLGFEDDVRNYTDAIQVLKSLRTKPVTLITNNPKKLEALQKAGLGVAERIPLWGDKTEYNEKYLKTKIARSGHLSSECQQ